MSYSWRASLRTQWTKAGKTQNSIPLPLTDRLVGWLVLGIKPRALSCACQARSSQQLSQIPSLNYLILRPSEELTAEQTCVEMHTRLLPPPGDLPLSPLCLKNDRDGSMHSTGRGSGGPALTPHLHVHLAASPNPNCVALVSRRNKKPESLSKTALRILRSPSVQACPACVCCIITTL